MRKILKVRKPSDYSAWVGQTDPHDLVSVIDYSEVSPVRLSLNSYDVYGIFLQGDDGSLDLTYGARRYDYCVGDLICVAPGQLGGQEDTGEAIEMSGWALLFHPDLLQGTGLEKDIKSFSFFEYRVNEALHMTPGERDVIIHLLKLLKEELKCPADSVQNRIIVGFINIILRYCERFYHRQFMSSPALNSDILTRFEAFVREYFESGEQSKRGVLTLQHCAQGLNMSPNYLGDLIKKTTGRTAGNYIKQQMVQRARNLLMSGLNSSQVAYELGFEYPQHFARMFKKLTGETPTEYCRRRTESPGAR